MYICVKYYIFFFFKQKTAYEILIGLVGSDVYKRQDYWGIFP